LPSREQNPIMHVWAQTKILVLTFLLSTCLTISTAHNILTDVPTSNPLNIWWSPAPPPEDGPPLSASASRDRSLLPAQIGGIIGAYLFSVCIVGIALICLGRKLRHQIQISPKALDIEMVEAQFQTAQATPRYPPLSAALSSPGGSRNFSWPSPENDIKNPYIFPPSLKSPRTPPPDLGNPYFDTRIVDADREMLNRDLEDIYAHVMAQEEAKLQGIKPQEMPLPAQLQRTGTVSTSPPQRQLTLPKKIEKSRPANLNIEETRSPKSSQSRISSMFSSLKSPKKSVKGMQISSPLPTPATPRFPYPQEDEEPLSPRYEHLPPPPPVPTDQVPFTHHRSTSNLTATLVPLPTSPRGNFGLPLSPRSPYPPSIRSHRSQYQNNPSQISVQSSTRGDASVTSQTPLSPLTMQPPPKRQPSPNPPTQPPSNNSSVRQLPLRQFEPSVTSPSFAPSTKTTVLERNGPVGGGGPQTGGLRTPWSAGAVPYSPYQPFTPMMPITPRLVTKEDRKAMKKKEGRTPVLEMIKSEDELWDSAY
jgi:hypothetical protein